MDRPVQTVRMERQGAVAVVTIDRPLVRNAIDGATAAKLADAFRGFADDDDLAVAVLTGAGGAFCSGADLKAISEGRGNRVVPFEAPVGDGDGPLGPTRMLLPKPVIAAIEGHAVAGGLELALWCDLRVASESAVFGVFCRRFGVPLIDGGTVRLPRLIGMSRALDMILTGRAVDAREALAFGLVNRVVETGGALAAALTLAHQLARSPQLCLRSDRLAAYEQWGFGERAALENELRRGGSVIASGETLAGASRFAAGEGRGGHAEPPDR